MKDVGQSQDGIPRPTHGVPATQPNTIILDPKIPRRTMNNEPNKNSSPDLTHVDGLGLEADVCGGIAGSRTATSSSLTGSLDPDHGIPGSADGEQRTEGDTVLGSTSIPSETSGSTSTTTPISGSATAPGGGLNRAPAFAAAIATAARLAAARRAALIAAVIGYAERGWLVIALQWPKEVDGLVVCSCWRWAKGIDCGRRSCKHPLWDNWPDIATTDVSKLKAWWRKFGVANVGLAMGYQPGGFYLVAIDEDAPGALAALAAEHGEPIPPTWTQKTGRGTHFMFVVPPELMIYVDAIRNRTKVVNGLDIRAQNGLIVASPSTSLSGATYTITNDIAPAPLPVWLFWLIADRGRAARVRAASSNNQRPAEEALTLTLDARIADGIARCLRHPPAIDGSGGNATTWSLVLALVRGLVLPRKVALDLLLTHYNNRCVGPWTDDALDEKSVFAEEKATSAWGFLLPCVDVASSNLNAVPAAASASASAPTSAAAAVDELNTVSPSVRQVSPSTPVSNIISVAAPPTRPVETREIATVRFRGTERRGVNGQHALRLQVVDGTHAGLTKRWPLDWPRTDRSAERLRHLAAALDLDEIRDPLRDTWDKTVRAELVKTTDGTVEVRRVFKP